MAAKYERIADDLRRQIQSGALAPGAQLEPESVLVDTYRVSAPTIRQAIGVLHAEGLTEARHGIGTFVRRPRQKIRRDTARYQWEKDRVHEPVDARSQAGATEEDTGLNVEDLDFFASYELIEAPAELAAIFKVPVGTRLLHRHYYTRSKSENVPLSLVDSYLEYDVVAANPDLLDQGNEPWPGGTQHQLSTIGIELDRIRDEVTARPPSADEAEKLDLGPGVSVLRIRKISIDTSDRVVEVADSIHAGDRSELVYTTPLQRWETA
jgi:GntR family transcriptional regulator